jgi:uncharacterized protein (TIGR03435 family)
MKLRMWCWAAMATALAAQDAFEVASIKPSDYRGGPLRVTGRVEPDGINFYNQTLAGCIQRAYAVKPYQVDGPAWIRTERYMIVAKAAGPRPERELLQMLQTLLKERFRLALHHEPREMPVYALVVARNGPKIKADTSEGATQIGAGDSEAVRFERASLDQLAGFLASELGRPVFNETGLKGLYSFQLPPGGGRGRLNQAAAEPAAEPSIFTAIQERLGLKLESRKAAVDVLVVDRAEKPSGN